MRDSIRTLIALSGGFGLSVVSLGSIWLGVAVHYQALLFFPFALLAFAITWLGSRVDKFFLLILAGAAPLGSFLLRFRDESNSHLIPILIVSAWLAGVLVGHGLAFWLRKNRS